jgi:hypothetical protein
MTGQLVLTTAFNYRAEQMVPFLHSLRLHHEGEVVLFTDIAAPDLAEPARTYGLRALPAAPGRFGPAIDRFAWARDLLAAEPRHEDVFLTDLRDVMFQDSPFAMRGEAPLELFLEPQRIGRCPMNRRWIAQAYGEAALAPLLEREICCVGTTRGSGAAMLGYLTRMAAEFEALADAGAEPFWGWDQAVHNRLAHGGEFGPASLHRSGEGAVQTLYYEGVFRFDRQGRLLNRDGRVCPVLHQYDRTMDLFRGAYMRNIYGPAPVRE